MRFGRFEENNEGEVAGFLMLGLIWIFMILFMYYESGTGGMLGMCAIAVFFYFLLTALFSLLESSLLSSGDSLRDTIILDEDGIRFERVKAEDIFVPWEEVYSIRLPVHERTALRNLEILDCSGRKVLWWPYNKKAMAYIWREHPEIRLTDEFDNLPERKWWM